MSEPIVFLASIAPTESGLKIHGIDGYRILLDVPNDELAAIMQLALLRGQVLRVSVTSEGEAPKAEPKRKQGKKQKERLEEWGDDSDDDTR